MAGLVVKITADTKGLEKALGDAGGGLEVFGQKINTKAVAGVAAMAGVAGIATAALIDMTGAAAADRDEANRLTTAIAAATNSTTDYTAAVDEAIAAGQAKAFSDSETRAALEPLVRATHDVTEATQLLALTQDVARAANVDLATAADAVAKASIGQDTALTKLLPGIEKGATATDTLANAQAAAAGAADTFANSSAGMAARTGDAFGELQESIGSALLPVLDELVPALLPIVELLGELLKAVLPVLIPLVKLLASALRIVLDVVKTLLKWLTDLIDLIGKGIGALGDFLGAINPFKGIALPGTRGVSSGLASAVVAPSIAAARAGGRSTSSGGSGGITINISGDPQTIEREVVRALRTHARRNGLSLAI